MFPGFNPFPGSNPFGAGPEVLAQFSQALQGALSGKALQGAEYQSAADVPKERLPVNMKSDRPNFALLPVMVPGPMLGIRALHTQAEAEVRRQTEETVRWLYTKWIKNSRKPAVLRRNTPSERISEGHAYLDVFVVMVIRFPEQLDVPAGMSEESYVEQLLRDRESDIQAMQREALQDATRKFLINPYGWA